MQRGFRGIMLAFPFILLASHIYFIGLAEQVELSFKILIALSFTLYIMVPCLIDRFLHKRFSNPFLSTLVYPAALIAIQFALSYVEQLGTILHWTGSMFSFKPLITACFHNRRMGSLFSGRLAGFNNQSVMGGTI